MQPGKRTGQKKYLNLVLVVTKARNLSANSWPMTAPAISNSTVAPSPAIMRRPKAASAGEPEPSRGNRRPCQMAGAGALRSGAVGAAGGVAGAMALSSDFVPLSQATERNGSNTRDAWQCGDYGGCWWAWHRRRAELREPDTGTHIARQTNSVCVRTKKQKSFKNTP